MSNRSAQFVAALFASILAGANLATVTDIRAQAAPDKSDNCLSAPKGDSVPAGSHWYYRIDRATKRQCWYLREENNRSARAAPQDSSTDAAAASTAADPAPPPPRPTARKSVANARAELTSPPPAAEPEPSAAIEPRTVGVTPAANFQNGPATAAPGAIAPSSAVATRWPDSSIMSPSTNFRTAAAEPPAAPQAQAKATPATTPATAPVALAAADASMETASMQMLLLVMAGALALAGITASLVFRFGRARAPRPEIRSHRRKIWDSIHTERPAPSMHSSPSMFPDEHELAWRRDAVHDPRAADDPERRVTEMLTKLARTAQS